MSEEITNGQEFHSSPVDTDKLKQSRYFREWYRLNSDYIAAKRKRRYHTDADYRERCLEATRKYSAERAERRKQARLARAHDPTPIVRDLTPTGRETVIQTPDGQKVKTLVFRVGEVQRRLQRSRASITNWLKHGILPQARYMTPSGFRLYTQDELECIEQTYTDVGMHAMVPGAIQAFRKLIKERWKKLPQGIDAGWREIHAPPLPEVVELRTELRA